MFCAQCGHSIGEGARFCNNCGAEVSTPASSVSTPAPTAAADGAAQPENAHGFETVFGPKEGAATGAAATGAAATGAAATTPARPEGLIARVKNILLSPATEWPLIANEPSSPRQIYLGYVAPLVAIGVIATFIGHSLVGIGAGFLGTYRVPIATGVITAIVVFLIGLLSVFLIALLVDVLAPKFGGQRDALRALKVTAYSYTPAWIAAVLHILPALGFVAILAGLYGLYLLYLGLPVLMRCPPEKSAGYTIVLVLCAIVMWIVLASVSTLTMCAVGGVIPHGALSQSGV